MDERNKTTFRKTESHSQSEKVIIKMQNYKNTHNLSGVNGQFLIKNNDTKKEKQ